jgi:WD40 repeat protein
MVWDAATGRPLSQRFEVNISSVSPDGRKVVQWSLPPESSADGASTGPWPRVPSILDTETGGTLVECLKDTQFFKVLPVRFSPDGRFVLLAYTQGQDVIRVWDASTGEPCIPPIPVSPPAEPDKGVEARAWFGPNGHWVVVAGGDGTTQVWDWRAGRPTGPPIRHGGRVIEAALSSDGRRVLTVGPDGARIWDAASARPLTPWLGHDLQLKGAGFSPTGRQVLTVSDLSIRIWDLAKTGASTRPTVLKGKQTPIRSSPDGLKEVRLDPFTVRVWDVTTNRPLTRPMIHTNSLNWTSLSLDGRRVVTAASDGTARVWDAATGRPLTPPLEHELRTVYGAVFSPDGCWLETRSWEQKQPDPDGGWLVAIRDGWIDDPNAVDGSGKASLGVRAARLWNVAADDRPITDLLRLSRLLSGHQIDETGTPVPLNEEEFDSLWADLRTRYPDDFRVTRADARAWREAEIGNCLREGNFKAAEFHYWWLVAELVQAGQPAKEPPAAPPKK